MNFFEYIDNEPLGPGDVNANTFDDGCDSGDVDGDGLADLTLYFRARQMDPPTPAECADPNAMIELTGNTTDGSAFKGTDRVTWSGC